MSSSTIRRSRKFTLQFQDLQPERFVAEAHFIHSFIRFLPSIPREKHEYQASSILSRRSFLPSIWYLSQASIIHPSIHPYCTEQAIPRSKKERKEETKASHITCLRWQNKSRPKLRIQQYLHAPVCESKKKQHIRETPITSSPFPPYRIMGPRRRKSNDQS